MVSSNRQLQEAVAGRVRHWTRSHGCNYVRSQKNNGVDNLPAAPVAGTWYVVQHVAGCNENTKKKARRASLVA
jgi:hypothetical protein